MISDPRNYDLSGDGCYTTHGGVVVSLGYDTDVYEYIMRRIPEACKLVVHVNRRLPAPAKEERRRGYFPERHVIERIQQLSKFTECVNECRGVLEKHGIVLVVCKGWNHRAPTVSNELLESGRYVMHATLRTKHRLPPAYVAILVHACISCRGAEEFYADFIRTSMDANEALRIRIGWTPGDPTTDEVFDVPSCVKRGAYVRVLQMDGFLITLEDVATKYSYKLPVTWLLPESTYARLEVYEAC